MNGHHDLSGSTCARLDCDQCFMSLASIALDPGCVSAFHSAFHFDTAIALC
jgi:hypothetical protein